MSDEYIIAAAVVNYSSFPLNTSKNDSPPPPMRHYLVPHMVEILLGVMAGRDFDDVVKHVLPKRKQKHSNECSNSSQCQEEGMEGVKHKTEGFIQKLSLSSTTNDQGLQGKLFPFFNHHHCNVA